jgi:membrane protein YfhO
LLVRWAFSRPAWRPLIELAGAVAAGTLLAGIQLVPFVDLLRHAQLISVRSAAGLGFAHLNLTAMSTWIFPNAVGNPSIDGRPGRMPNFNESTGFAGVAAFVLSPVGAWWSWRRERSVAIALVGIAAISAGIVYGPLAPIAGRLPGFAVSNNQRAIVVLCFCVAALGGLGLDGLMRSEALAPIKVHARSVLGLGALGLGGVAVVGLLVWSRGARVDALLPQLHGYIGFWLLAGGLAFATAVGFVVGAFVGGSRNWAAAGLCGLALVEGTLFAGTFNPREPLAEVPPPSPAMTWLRDHAEGRPIAALGTTMLAESAVLYGLTDVRGYEILADPRERTYWAAADPGYDDSRSVTLLNQPAAPWLAAAGVAYVMMPAAQSIAGTNVVYSEPGVTIVEVPDPRPFAFPATSVATAGGPDQAVALLAKAPLGPVVVEGCCPATGAAVVEVTQRSPGSVDLEVSAEGAATIVVEQSFQSGWEAAVDGKPVTIQPANVLFQSVQVPEGRHAVTLRYRPASVAIGAATSGAGALALVALLIAALVRPRRQRLLPR